MGRRQGIIAWKYSSLMSQYRKKTGRRSAAPFYGAIKNEPGRSTGLYG